MKQTKLRIEIQKAQKKVDLLGRKNKALDDARRKRWTGRFVNDNRVGNRIDPNPTELGLKELAKYNIEFVKESIKESKEWMWENPGISYTPKKCFCMICGDTWTVAWMQMGMAPRFATCSKHTDFLMMFAHIRKIK